MLDTIAILVMISEEHQNFTLKYALKEQKECPIKLEPGARLSGLQQAKKNYGLE